MALTPNVIEQQRAPLTREGVLALREAHWHVIGAATAEGVAVSRLLVALGFPHVTVHDSRDRAVLRAAFRTTHGAFARSEQDEIWDELEPLRARGHFADDYLTGLGTGAPAPTVVVLGQGWYLEADARDRIRAAIPPGAIVTGMTELYFAFARGPIAAITGTNGKSTTVALVDHLLDVAPVVHHTAGNERSSRQFLADADQLPAHDWTLLEISNRQLLQLSGITGGHCPTQVAAITSLTPDHLAEHGGWDAYRAAKASLFAAQPADGIAIVNADSDDCTWAVAHSPATVVRCGIESPATAHGSPAVCWRADGALVARDMPVHGSTPLAGERVLAHRSDLTIPGDHNLRNAAVAVAVALACGAPPGTLADGLRGFAGKSLRLELIGRIDEVDVYSDIKSTTPEATVAALQAIAPQRAVLVLGGDDKGLDYAPLAREIVARETSVVFVPGSATDAIGAQLAALGAPAAPVEQHLAAALDTALACATAGDAVIVSPAAAGFWTRYLQGSPSLRTLVRRRREASARGARQ